MDKKFFVNVFFNVANVDFFMLHALLCFDVVYVIFKCCKKIYMLHATFTHITEGIFDAKLPSDTRPGCRMSGR